MAALMTLSTIFLKMLSTIMAAILRRGAMGLEYPLTRCRSTDCQRVSHAVDRGHRRGGLRAEPGAVRHDRRDLPGAPGPRRGGPVGRAPRGGPAARGTRR